MADAWRMGNSREVGRRVAETVYRDQIITSHCRVNVAEVFSTHTARSEVLVRL
jgi:hypothetical protein